MNWTHYHTVSEQYASQAEAFCKQQNLDCAVRYYRLAADAELKALQSLDPHKTRTLGVTVVSVVSLYKKAQEFALAEQIARQWLESELLPSFAVKELGNAYSI